MNAVCSVSSGMYIRPLFEIIRCRTQNGRVIFGASKHIVTIITKKSADFFAVMTMVYCKCLCASSPGRRFRPLAYPANSFLSIKHASKVRRRHGESFFYVHIATTLAPFFRGMAVLPGCEMCNVGCPSFFLGLLSLLVAKKIFYAKVIWSFWTRTQIQRRTSTMDIHPNSPGKWCCATRAGRYMARLAIPYSCYVSDFLFAACSRQFFPPQYQRVVAIIRVAFLNFLFGIEYRSNYHNTSVLLPDDTSLRQISRMSDFSGRHPIRRVHNYINFLMEVN